MFNAEATSAGAAEGARVRRDLPRRPTGDHIHHHVGGDDDDNCDGDDDGDGGNDDNGDGVDDGDGVERVTRPPFQHGVIKGAFGTYAQSLPGCQSPIFGSFMAYPCKMHEFVVRRQTAEPWGELRFLQSF